MNAQEIMREVFVLSNVDEISEQVSVDSTDFQIIRMLAFLNETGRELVSRAPWRTLVKSETLSNPETRGNVHALTLPDDFHRPVERGALIDESSGRPVAVENDYGKWSTIRSVAGVAQAEDTYATLMNNEVLITKPVSIGLTYVSKNWVSDGGDSVSTNDATFLVPDRCLLLGTKYRYLRLKAEEEFEDAKADYETSILSEINASRNQGAEVSAD